MLKLVIWILAALPGINLFYLVILDKIGANPQETLLRELGTWALIILLLTYSLPVLAKIGFAQVLSCRRILGLWAFFYASMHFTAFLIFENELILSSFIKDLTTRPFVTIGFLAFLLLIPLAITSNKYSMINLGKYWKKIHLLVNPIILLSVVHYFLHRTGKNDFFEPAIALVIFAGIFLLKIKRPSKKGRRFQ